MRIKCNTIHFNFVESFKELSQLYKARAREKIAAKAKKVKKEAPNTMMVNIAMPNVY